jgi:salicylate hydroxylase
MALGLALSGHTVRVLEKNQGLGASPGGIRLTPNVTKILVQWGLANELRAKGSLVREGSHLWNCKCAEQRHPLSTLRRSALSFLVANRLS